MTSAPVHYIGNKSRLLEPIAEAVAALLTDVGEVVDLFSGSGVVTARLSNLAPVVSIDIQHYSGTLARAQTSAFELDVDAWISAAESLSGEYSRRPGVSAILAHEARALQGDDALLIEMLESGSGMARMHAPRELDTALGSSLREAARHRRLGEGVLFHYYSGPYFGYAQGIALDALSVAARALPSSGARDTATAIILGIASELATSVGNHFAQPLKVRDRSGAVKTSHIRRAASKREVDLWARVRKQALRYSNAKESPHPISTFTGDFRAALDTRVRAGSVIYADPPYTRDHYSRFYHVLETIVLGDEPGFALLPGRGVPRGLYRQERHQSDFSIVSRAPKAFESLFAQAHRLAAPVVLSYSPVDHQSSKPRSRAAALASIVDIAQRTGYSVEVRPVEGVQHSRFNSARHSVPAPVAAESLIIASPL